MEWNKIHKYLNENQEKKGKILQNRTRTDTRQGWNKCKQNSRQIERNTILNERNKGNTKTKPKIWYLVKMQKANNSKESHNKKEKKSNSKILEFKVTLDEPLHLQAKIKCKQIPNSKSI